MSSRVRLLNKEVYGGTPFSVPGHLNFGQYLIDALKGSAADSNKVALVNGDTGEETTFKKILQEVVNAATGLRRLGVKRGDVVAFCSENRDEFITCAVAAVCCGATVTTANLQYTEDEMIYVLNIAKPVIMFSSEAALKLNLKAFKSVPSIKMIIQLNGVPAEKILTPYSSIVVQTNVEDFEVTDVQGANDVVYILYSSGTTGLPKGVMLTHLNVLYSAVSFGDHDRLDGKDTVRSLSIAPWYHAFGLMTTTNYLALGIFNVYFTGFNPNKYLKAIEQYKITKLITVPPLVVFLGKSPVVEKFDLSSVKVVWSGAAPLSAETIDGALKRLPNCRGIYQGYGMTETSLGATQVEETEFSKPKSGTVGPPLRGIKAKVVDPESRRKLEPNQTGEICFKGPILMKGYYGNEAATRAMFDEEGYLKTGDIGYYEEDGCFFIVDRLKELIKYKGYQVPPALVESVVLQHEGVAECGVVGQPDEAVGELPVAFVVLKPGASATEKDIIEFANARLSPEKRLYGGVIFTKEIPKNPSGKILRRLLKQQLRVTTQ